MGGHLRGEALDDYVDGRLDPATSHRVDQHLLCCSMCRGTVEDERLVRARLRSVRTDPRRQEHLVAGLLDLARTQAPAPSPEPRRPAPVTVRADAPPQYRSARHPLACAVLAVAGCLSAATVVVTAVPHSQGQPGPQVSPSTRGPQPATTAWQSTSMTGRPGASIAQVGLRLP